MMLLLLLPLTMGTTIQAAPDRQSDPNESLSPAALIARIMSAGEGPGDGVERLRPEDVMRKLWHNRISGPGAQEDAQTQIELERMIQRVRSVRFGTSERPDTVRSPVSLMEDGPGGTAQAPETAADQTVPAIVTKPAARTRALPAEAGETLGRLLSNPDLARDPLAIAELLFLSGRPAEASVLYRKALDVATGDSPAAREDRAWILLQLGTCLRQTDVTQAKGMYARLIAEYPQSPWVELAKAHHQLLLWQERVQLDPLMVGQAVQPTEQTHVARGLP